MMQSSKAKTSKVAFRSEKRRGQVALEYLTTYGFALLVLLTTLGVINYLGVFNIGTLRTNECNFPTGVACNDYKVNPSGAVNVILLNEYGVNLTITDMNATAREFGVVGCTPDNANWDIGRNVTVTCNFAVGSFVEGNRYDVNFEMAFRQRGGTYVHNIRGTMSAVGQ